MKVSNVEIMGLDSSIIASGYPMVTNIYNIEKEIYDIRYWIDNNISAIINILESDDRFSLDGENIRMKVTSTSTLISPEDLIEVSKNKWTFSGKYIYMQNSEIPLHKFIMGENEKECVDHINRDRLDNTRENLRGASKQENTFNCGLSLNNTSGVTGVAFSKSKNKWRSYINIDGKQLFLGYYNDINDAIKERLIAELKYFKEFAPQKNLFEKYGIIIDYTKELKRTPISSAIKHFKRFKNLSNTEKGSAHDQSLTGIVVNFDLRCTNKMWVELERYRFINFVSSQSTMHRITKLDIRQQCNDYVWDSTIDKLEGAVRVYNQMATMNLNPDVIKDKYLEILYNVPSGFELTARLTTNYRALKTVYSQRHQHKLPEWREFCEWIKTLPMAEDLIVR